MAPIVNTQLTDAGDSVYEATHVDYSDISGTVYELFDIGDVSINEDPSFHQFVDTVTGLAAVNAVAITTGTVSASSFDGLFKIETDSDDLTDADATDIKFSFDGTVGFPTVSFGASKVVTGAISGGDGTTQTIAHDFVRHIAYRITGGYSSADIFNNESTLVNAVNEADTSLNTSLTSRMSDLTFSDAHATQTTDLTDDQQRLRDIAKQILGLRLANDSDRTTLLADLADNGNDGVASLKFAKGDAIAVRVNYKPNNDNSSQDLGMGGNTITDRSYKILIKLS